MAVITKYLSDRDPKTMFDDKKAADEYDAKLEREEGLAALLEDAAKASDISLGEDAAFKMARFIIDNRGDELAAAAVRPKLKKQKSHTEG